MSRIRSRWLDLSQSLGFIPGVASSQFSPRIRRTFFGDRVTQITIGTYVGTFVYAILVLRAVGSFGDSGFVPRLSVTVASLLGIAAVVLLIVYLNHVSRMVQVSHVSATIAHDTLARMARLYPEGYGEPLSDERQDDVLRTWRSQAPGPVLPRRPGYVQRVDVDALADGLPPSAERVAILVCPGDFVSAESTVVEVWPAGAAQLCRDPVLGALSIASERDLDQDVDFGVRQLTDTAIKAMSPGINDPATAVTCIGYLRSILVRLTERADLPAVRRYPDRPLTVIVRRRGFDEYFESTLQINRYLQGDAWVIGELLQALQACVDTARRHHAGERVRILQDIAETVAEQASGQLASRHDRDAIERLMAQIGPQAGD